MHRYSSSRLAFVAVLLALIASGCTLPTAIAPEPSLGEPEDSDRAALAEARARWATADVSDYAFTYQESCFCPPEFSGPFRITVENGRVDSVTRNGRAATEQRTYPTIDALFDVIEDAFDRDAETVQVSYDADLGLPVNAYIDYEAAMADEELGFTVTRFTR